MSPLLQRATVVALLFSSAPASAQTSRSGEFSALRAEMAKIAARLDTLEREEAGKPSSANPMAQASIPPAPVAGLPTLKPADAAALDSRAIVQAPLDRPLQPDGFGFQLSASSDATSVAIKAARSRSVSGDTHGTYRTIAVTASAPLASGARFSDIGTLDGFTNSSKLRLQYSFFKRRITDPADHPGFAALVEATKARCRAVLVAPAPDCNPQLISSQFVHTYAPELETTLLAMARSRADGSIDWSARAYGVEGSIGYKNYKFLLSGPARNEEAKRVPIGAKVFYSYLPDVRRNSITGALEYQRSYKERTAGALCPVPDGASELTCLTGPLGGPSRANKLIGSVEYRHQLFLGEEAFIPAIGFSTMFSYDALNNDFGVDVPIYLVADAKGLLTGGVRFGYTTSGKDDLAVGVFVGTGFSLR